MAAADQRGTTAAEKRWDAPLAVDITTLTSVELVVHMLQDSVLPALKDGMGLGVPPKDFESLLWDTVFASSPHAAAHGAFIRRSIQALFGEIDVNGNGEVDWEEFSHHVLHSTITGAEHGAVTAEAKRIVFDHSSQVPLAGARLYKRACAPLHFCGGWSLYAFIETIHGEGLTRTRVSLYRSVISDPALFVGTTRKRPPNLGLYAQLEIPMAVHSAAMIVSMKRLVLATATNQLLFLALYEDTLASQTGQLQRLEVEHRQHLEGVFNALVWDPESDKLLAGGSDGWVLVMCPHSTHKLIPDVQMSFHAKCPSVTDMIVLPERGAKKIVVGGIDGRIRVFDLSRGGTLISEIGDCVSPCSMAFSEEYSVLVTCSPGDPDPSVWSPHAAQNAFVRKLVPLDVGSTDDDRKGAGEDDDVDVPDADADPAASAASNGARAAVQRVARSQARLVRIVPGTPFVCVVDNKGTVRWWDIRTMQPTFALRSNGEAIVSEDRMHAITCPAVAIDPHRLELLCISRYEAQYTLNQFRSRQATGHDEAVTHDSEVVGCVYVEALHWIITASRDEVNVWDAGTGVLTQRIGKLWGAAPRRISSLAAESHGRRIIVGTLQGSLTMHSTSTGAELSVFPQHSGPVTTIRLSNARSVVAYSSPDGSVLLADFSKDPPSLIARTRLDGNIAAMDLCERLSLVTVADSMANLTEIEFAPSNPGAVIATTTPPPDPFARVAAPQRTGEDADLEAFMNPARYEMTAVTTSRNRPYVVAADARGFLHFITVRPHSNAHTRYARWRTYSAKSSRTLFAVALCLAIDDETHRLYVGDDQGNLTMWDLAELVAKTRVDEAQYPGLPAPLPLPDLEPLQLQPKFRGAFAVQSRAVPIREVIVLPSHRAVVAVSERSVSLWGLTGLHLGSLVQGRCVGQETAGGFYAYRPGGSHRMLDEADDEAAASATEPQANGKGGDTSSSSAQKAPSPPRDGRSLRPPTPPSEEERVQAFHHDVAMRLLTDAKLDAFVPIPEKDYAALYPPVVVSAQPPALRSPGVGAATPQAGPETPSLSAGDVLTPMSNLTSGNASPHSGRRIRRPVSQQLWRGTADAAPPGGRPRMTTGQGVEARCRTPCQTPVTQQPPTGRLRSQMPQPFANPDSTVRIATLTRTTAEHAKPRKGLREVRPLRAKAGVATEPQAASSSQAPALADRDSDEEDSDPDTAERVRGVAEALTAAINAGDAGSLDGPPQPIMFNRKALDRVNHPTVALATQADQFATRTDFVGDCASELALLTAAEKALLPDTFFAVVAFKPHTMMASRAGLRERPTSPQKGGPAATGLTSELGNDSFMRLSATLSFSHVSTPAFRNRTLRGPLAKRTQVPGLASRRATAAPNMSLTSMGETPIPMATIIDAPGSAVAPVALGTAQSAAEDAVSGPTDGDGGQFLWGGTIAAAEISSASTVHRHGPLKPLRVPPSVHKAAHDSSSAAEVPERWTDGTKSIFVYEPVEETGAARQRLEESLMSLRADTPQPRRDAIRRAPTPGQGQRASSNSRASTPAAGATRSTRWEGSNQIRSHLGQQGAESPAPRPKSQLERSRPARPPMPSRAGTPQEFGSRQDAMRFMLAFPRLASGAPAVVTGKPE